MVRWGQPASPQGTPRPRRLQNGTEPAAKQASRSYPKAPLTTAATPVTTQSSEANSVEREPQFTTMHRRKTSAAGIASAVATGGAPAQTSEAVEKEVEK